MKSRHRCLHWLTAIFVPTIALHAQVAAQSDAASIETSVTVESASVAVTPAQDLIFGNHFAAAGTVPQQASGVWTVESEVAVDLTLSVLPSELTDNAGNAVPLIYGSNSFAAFCREPDGNPTRIPTHPSVGVSDCVPSAGISNVALGFSGDISEGVFVDLTGAAPGTYSAVIELTATVH